MPRRAPWLGFLGDGEPSKGFSKSRSAVRFEFEEPLWSHTGRLTGRLGRTVGLGRVDRTWRATEEWTCQLGAGLNMGVRETGREEERERSC